MSPQKKKKDDNEILSNASKLFEHASSSEQLERSGKSNTLRARKTRDTDLGKNKEEESERDRKKSEREKDKGKEKNQFNTVPNVGLKAIRDESSKAKDVLSPASGHTRSKSTDVDDIPHTVRRKSLPENGSKSMRPQRHKDDKEKEKEKRDKDARTKATKKDKDNDREKEKDKHKSAGQHRDRDRERERPREKDRDRERERERDAREKERDRDRRDQDKSSRRAGSVLSPRSGATSKTATPKDTTYLESIFDM